MPGEAQWGPWGSETWPHDNMGQSYLDDGHGNPLWPDEPSRAYWQDQRMRGFPAHTPAAAQSYLLQQQYQGMGRKKKRNPAIAIAVLAIFAVAVALIAIHNSSSSDTSSSTPAVSTGTDDSTDTSPPDYSTPDVPDSPADAGLPSFGQPGYCETTAPSDPACNLPTGAPTTAAPAAETASQASAVDKAKDYLSVIGGFSRQSLIDQLVTGDSFSTEDATYAVDSLNIDYNAQAASKAKDYQKTIGGFSHQGLVEQLETGDSFTPDQAEYGVSQTGL